MLKTLLNVIKGQPVLVGTASVEKSELVSSLLRQAGIPHEVLNAKQHEREAGVIAMAGRKKEQSLLLQIWQVVVLTLCLETAPEFICCCKYS